MLLKRQLFEQETLGKTYPQDSNLIVLFHTVPHPLKFQFKIDHRPNMRPGILKLKGEIAQDLGRSNDLWNRMPESQK